MKEHGCGNVQPALRAYMAYNVSHGFQQVIGTASCG